MARKVKASLITAILCCVEVKDGTTFRFCIPSGISMDFDEMEELAREQGVTGDDWLRLLHEIEKEVDNLN
jgi:hypothetical protein